jgi:hypothetical protein
MLHGDIMQALVLGMCTTTAACAGYDIRATDGRVMHQGSWNDLSPTILASATHDLACDRVTDVIHPGRQLFSAEGCGRRATYAIVRVRGERRALLVGRVPLEPGDRGGR